MAKPAELSQTQHRLRLELQSTVSGFESMQASAGEEATLYECGGRDLFGLGALSAIAAAVMLWQGRKVKGFEPAYVSSSTHGPKGSR